MSRIRQILLILIAIFVLSVFPARGSCVTNILNIRHWAAPDHTRIVIDTSDDAIISVTRDTQKVTLDFSGAQLPEDMRRQTVLNKPEFRKSSPRNWRGTQ